MHFSPQSGGKARCDICKAMLAYTGGTFIKFDEAFESKTSGSCRWRRSAQENPGKRLRSIIRRSQRRCGHNAISCDHWFKEKPVKQNTLRTYMVRPVSVSRQKRLNSLKLKMVAKDLQPFSVVTDIGFREFVAALDSSYSLPSRTTLTKELLPSA